jgi:hypothetical protein
MKQTKIADIAFIQNESNASSMEGTGKWIMLPMIRITMVHYSSTLFVTNTESGAVAHNNYNFEISWGAGANALGFRNSSATRAHWNNFKTTQ